MTYWSCFCSQKITSTSNLFLYAADFFNTKKQLGNPSKKIKKVWKIPHFAMHAPSLTGWNGGYRKSIPCILFVKFLTFEQESIKAKLDNNSVRQGLRKGSLQFDIQNDLLPSDTRVSV